MSYQVLARKYRPANFQELEGQQHVLQALVNALENNRLHHAYLFTGTRGTGKTTIARILAKCLNCESGVTATPCGTCGSCTEIAEGRSVDLIEVDAASRTGVDDMRELLENVQYMPTVSRYKVYLIDEVHMLSKNSFNAMLKTLEEPPEHVKFLFATTDPKKLPITVLSRCLQFNLKNLTPEQVVKYLQQVLQSEEVEFEEAALWQLGHAADGSMRDALSLTDQAISYGDNAVKEAEVRAMLGSIDQGEVFGLFDALVAQDGAKLLDKVAALSEFAPDYAGLLDSLLSLLHRLAVAVAVPGVLDNSQGDKERIEKLASDVSAEQVQLLYQIGLIGAKDLPHAPSQRTGFEMVLLRMMSFGLADAGEPEPVAKPEPAAKTATKPAASAAAAPAAATEPASESEDEPAPETELATEIEPVPETATATATATAPAPEPTKAPAATDKTEAPPLDGKNWAKILGLINLDGVTRTLAVNCNLSEARNGHCLLLLDEQHASLWNNRHEERIGQALSDLYGRELKVSVKVGTVSAATPADAESQQRRQTQAKAVADISNDANVQRLIEGFDGKLDPDSISPQPSTQPSQQP